MVPLCSTTWRAEYKRVRLSNRGLASHRAVSPTSESTELVTAFLVTSESSDLMTGSCRSYTAARPATSKSRPCVMQKSGTTWILSPNQIHLRARQVEAKVPGSTASPADRVPRAQYGP